MTCLQEFHLGSESVVVWLGRGRAKCSVVSGEVRAAAALALRTSLLMAYYTLPTSRLGAVRQIITFML